MTIRTHGFIGGRKVVNGVSGWRIKTDRSKDNRGFFAPAIEIPVGYKPRLDEEVTFVVEKVQGRRCAHNVQPKKKVVKQKTRPRLRRASFAVAAVVLFFIFLL